MARTTIVFIICSMLVGGVIHAADARFEVVSNGAVMETSSPAAGQSTTFPVFREGDYFDTALYRLGFLLAVVGPHTDAGFSGTTLAFLHTRRYLGLSQFAELVQLMEEAYPEGVVPVVLLYQTWRRDNPTLADAPPFIEKLREEAAREEARPETEDLVASLGEYIARIDDYAAILDAAADNLLATRGIAITLPSEPSTSTLYNREAIDNFERFRKEMAPQVATGEYAPIFHISLPNPSEVIPLTRAFDTLEAQYGFTKDQMAAAAFGLRFFVFEGIPGRIIGDNELFRISFQLGLNSGRHGQDRALEGYSAFTRQYFSDLDRRVDSLLHDANAKAVATALFSQLHERYKSRSMDINRQVAELFEKGVPGDPEGRAAFERRLNALKYADLEYSRWYEYRRRNSIY